MSDSPARTQRSVPGMIGAMLVLLLIIGVFVAVRSFTRDNVEVPPTPVDYLAAVALVQDRGLTVLYPAELPPAWVVTSVEIPRTADHAWGLGMLTDERRFVAIREDSGSQDALVRSEMGVQARIGEALDVPGSFVTGWRRVTAPDESGLVSAIPGGALVVYGTADPGDIELLAATLVQEPLGSP